MSPYRTPHMPEAASRADDEAEGCPDGELLPIFFVFWFGSVARVVLGVKQRETFGAEGTLALLAVPAALYLARNALAWWVRRLWRRLRHR